MLLHLYEHKNSGDLQTAIGIAKATGIAYPAVSKVGLLLKKKNIVNIIQGRNGGYALGKSPHEISVYDVFTAVGGELQIKDCLQSDLLCDEGNQDMFDLQVFFCNFQDKVIEEMKATSIADLAH